MTIRFLEPHGGAAGFTDPTGDFAYVAVEDSDGIYVRSIIQGNRLSRMREIKVNVDHAIGDRGEEPRAKKVFSVPGVYVFRVAAALDLEDPILDGQCAVRLLRRYRIQ